MSALVIHACSVLTSWLVAIVLCCACSTQLTWNGASSDMKLSHMSSASKYGIAPSSLESLMNATWIASEHINMRYQLTLWQKGGTHEHDTNLSPEENQLAAEFSPKVLNKQVVS